MEEGRAGGELPEKEQEKRRVGEKEIVDKVA
jgi:hypothetical protein